MTTTAASRQTVIPPPRPAPSTTSTGTAVINDELFIDPMMGAPLAIYIEKDVADKQVLTDLIAKHGGTVSVGYSGVPYILVDPHKESGQNLYRQYAGKKGKIILDARWVHLCVERNELQTFQHNWGGCKVSGNESSKEAPPAAQTSNVSRSTRNVAQPQAQVPRGMSASQPLHPHAHAPTIPPLTMTAAVDSLGQPTNAYPYPVYAAPLQPHAGARVLSTPATAPPQTWQSANGIAAPQTHMQPASAHLLTRSVDPSWDSAYSHPPASTNPLVGPSEAPTYDYRYPRDDQSDQWVGGTEYYDPAYEHAYDQSTPFISEPGPSTQSVSSNTIESADKARGRKRTRNQPATSTAASALVNSRAPPARSPTPPTRVIKSTYGGNLFTADDVEYLKKYIDYCQEQGLVLSLREICERIAIKAPHHTFYSWRRYCNKHQIRLGGYAMATDRPSSSNADQDAEDESGLDPIADPIGVPLARLRVQQDGKSGRDRSPTPPRALFRSTTGKGVAFTQEDINFLIKFMNYRKSQGRLDMVAFWKDVATRAPHHSRASWMKYWRRHKHELNHTENDEPLPNPPEKKMRYSREDDILLAKYFSSQPDGTSDKIFQSFGRSHPHHPWKGWQEHHRIHKNKIDHLVQRLANGETIDVDKDSAR